MLNNTHRRNGEILRRANQLTQRCRQHGLALDPICAALILSVRAHTGQTRHADASPYVTHPIQVAEVVTGWGADESTVVVALLHDVAEDAPSQAPWIEAQFGRSVAARVAALTKNATLATKRERTIDLMSRLNQAIARHGPAVGWVKLADRAHNLATSAALPQERRQTLLTNTAEFVVPLAGRLGMHQLADWMLRPSAWDLGPDPAHDLLLLGKAAVVDQTPHLMSAP
jgi:guanosine-3',5'-bis(diphosphate) 3'-pyrophosphohydrolase